MSKITIEQKKERLVRELQKLESEEKRKKENQQYKEVKRMGEEIFKYDIDGYDNLIKIIGLLRLFEYKNDGFRNGIIAMGETELEERKKQKVRKIKINREPSN